eukprot:CAMPEP_0115329272 /NCGR_PEP_ID=MMETSP0270-20121206/85140_1 /TAXON_ID=71861 /ORGANISM="Scrippsiella trochoidea, Strain CCMP3099" /LENGTH=33 /DNA_ID= /DNA_START= /DNA_END= /DNA_ORIENTATION=
MAGRDMSHHKEPSSGESNGSPEDTSIHASRRSR